MSAGIISGSALDTSKTLALQPSSFSVYSPPSQPLTGLKRNSDDLTLVFTAPSAIRFLAYGAAGNVLTSHHFKRRGTAESFSPVICMQPNPRQLSSRSI